MFKLTHLDAYPVSQNMQRCITVHVGSTKTQFMNLCTKAKPTNLEPKTFTDRRVVKSTKFV